ncbi:hypothetical protein QBC46DRAFT_416139 [Diplogelasinospora grovesii]|uniref:Uncharacterized protein n=1 Tax=Diplogelasinospora grovesii TaxID=303347 RepID=A0AAN6N2P3_9PEZI|nr:hypothetical protein QBC46DRAFT_416139 [Diplogelasinospora grovesii]
MTTFAADPYGAGGFGCPPFWARFGTSGSPQALCCDNLEKVNPFLPVRLGWLFPTLPPDSDIPVYNFTHIAHELRKLAPRDVVVHELSFSYDFRKVRPAAADDPVYVRIDYSSMSDWWYEVMDRAPSRKRDPNSDIRKRFWSKSDDTWKNKIAQVRQSTNNGDEQLLPLSTGAFSNLIYQQTLDTCAAPSSKRTLSDDGFLSVYLDSWITT